MKIFVIGSGPEVEGHVVAEAVRALTEHGHEVVLLEPSESSTAKAWRTYLEPLTLEAALGVIAAEKPQAILAGIGRRATRLALELEPKLKGVKWLGPKPKELLAEAVADADTVVEVAGGLALGQIEQLGDTWICPAPLHRPELDEQVKKLKLKGCARVHFKDGKLAGVDPIVSTASAFTSRALGVSIPRLAVRLALGLEVDQQPKPGPVAVRRGEVMTLSNPAPAVAPGRSVVVLGAAAGVEQAIRAEGLEPIVVDANPSAFSGTAARYYEAAALEAVVAVCRKEQPRGVIVQFGGNAASRLAGALEAEGVLVLGTRGADLQRALDGEQFARVVSAAGLQEPARGLAATLDEATALAGLLHYPLLVRAGPQLSYVANEAELKGAFRPGVTLQAFLAEATQACVELLRDKTGKVVVAGVVEHVEQAGVHGADAAYTLPPHSLKPEVVEKLKDAATALANGLEVVGLLDVQFALQGKAVWVLEANPRATRSTPFVAKATGLDLYNLGARVMLGRTLADLGLNEDPVPSRFAVREAVFDENVALGPTKRSTGGVMAVAASMHVAFGKSQLAAGTGLPAGGMVFLSVTNDDKPAVVDLAQRLLALGFTLACTVGTHEYLQRKGVSSTRVKKATEGSTQVLEMVAGKKIALIICTVGLGDYVVGQDLRAAARSANVSNFTTVEAARMAVGALEARAAVTQVTAV